jgi:hypothetical protein
MNITFDSLISELKLVPAQAEQILSLISGETEPQTYVSVKDWVNQCFHEPEQHEQVMKAIDEILETCGVEALSESELPYGDNASEPFALYCNVGDPYVATIAYLIEEDEYIISGWADVMERKEKESDEEAEGEHRSEILEGIAKCFWVNAWADHVQEAECQNLSQEGIYEIAPEIPDLARELAEKAAQEISAANSDCSLDLLYRTALKNNINEGTGYSDKKSGPERFGNCLAYEMLGYGITWSDDNSEHGLTIPHDETPQNKLFDYASWHCENCHKED